MSESFVKKPCKHCPFKKDVRPFLHPKRAREIAESAYNQYAFFPCHKTLDHDEDGDTYAGAKSKECAGHLTMKANLLEEAAIDYEMSEGFKPDYKGVYSDEDEMVAAYEEEWGR